MTWQERACNNKWVRVAVSVVLTVAVLLVFVLSPFAQARAIVGVDDAAIVIIIAGLAAIGITFATTGGFDTLNDYVGSLLQDYSLDNNIPVTSVFKGTQYSANSAGKLLLNNRFVTLIDTFAQWLIGKYNLANNSSYALASTGATIDGITLYDLPFELRYSTAVYTEWTQYVGAGAYCVLVYNGTNHNQVYAGFLSETSGTIIQVNGWGQTQTIELVKNSGEYLYHSTSSNVFGSEYNWQSYNIAEQTEFVQSYKDSDAVIDVNNIGVGIKTGSISLPTDDVDYTSGDGAVLDIGAKWGSTYGGAIASVPEIWPEWLEQSQNITAHPDVSIEYESEVVLEDALPQPADIENIPGAALPLLDEDGHIQNLSFSSLWHYVAQWISDMTAGAAVVWNVATLAPSPVVNMLYAMIVLAMFFGAVKVFR